MEQDEKTILAYKLYPLSDSSKGFICPLAELQDGKYFAVSRENFCETEKVFITTAYYEDIDKKFQELEFFNIQVHESVQRSELVEADKACNFVSQGFKAERLRPKDCVQIIIAELPDSNNRQISIDFVRPSTEYIFVLNSSGECFGPFKWNIEEDGILQLNLITTSLPGPTIPPSHIFKVSQKMIDEYCCSNKGFDFIFDLSSVLNKSNSFDYSSDEEVARFCSKIAGDVNLQASTKATLKMLEGQIRKFPKYSNNSLVKERLERLNDIVDNQLILQEDVRSGFVKFLRNSVGESLLEQYVSENESKYLAKIKLNKEQEIDKELSAKWSDLNSISDKLKSKKEEYSTLSLEVEQKRVEAKSEARIEEASIKWDETIRSKQQEYASLENNFNTLTEKYKEIYNLDRISSEISEKEAEVRVLNKQISSHEDSLRSIKSELSSKDEELQKKLMGMKPYVDAINGAFFSNQVHLPNVTVSINPFSDQKTDKIIQQKLFIISIQENLRRKGRNISQIDVANLIISTQQSFLCFLAGLPGIGKTSLSRLFTEIQGLQPRFKEISVARGWTSQKDLIGFFNPLSNRFQSANSNLYHFLRSIDEDSKKTESPMAYVLLDEANLSPIEHYWSAFMGMTDSIDRQLSLGQESINIPNSLRFIATINYDSTTEPLSPRIVDRAPIIILEGTVASDQNTQVDQLLVEFPISQKTMDDLFGCSNILPDFTEDEYKNFSEIQKILSNPNLELGRPLYISPRKEAAIRQYCNKARAIMQILNDGDELMALDYSILQHVLPQVRGNGPKFKNRLDLLKKHLESENLTKSSKYVDRMLSYGADELHTYDFFCW